MSPRGKKAAARSPRRKAGRVASRKPRKLKFTLIVDAQEMLVEYEANWSEGEFPYGHFEFRSPQEPPRAIPISETGYRSHFAPMADIEAAGGPESFARQLVDATLKASRKKGKTDDKQLSLF